ncbi:MAG: InlB B-repeat-containing protein [Paludibacteraceae bacterium]|nr:InlB B-repeat-containing protein [Paludibacteraceae bacterium]
MKTRSVLIIFFCLAAIHASAQLFVSQDKRDVAFQGQQSFKSPQTMRTVSNYVGTVYTPFGSEVPSDQSGIGSNNDEGGQPGHIRKGKILGPDTDPANQSPIGEPWILLAFAALFGGFIAWRKKNRKLEIYKPNNHDESKNTKDMNNFFKNQMNYDGRTTVERRSNNGQSQGHYTLGLTKLIFTLTLLLTLAVGQMWAWYVPGTINGTYWGTTDNNMGSDNSITFYAVAGGTYQFQLTNGSNWGGNGCIQSVSGVTKGTNGSNATITFSGTKDITITVVDETNWKVSVTASDPTYHIKYNWYSSGWSWVELSQNGDGTYSCNGLYRANTKAFDYIKRSSDSDDGMNYKDGTSGVTLTNSPAGGDNCVFTFNPSGATLNIHRCNKVTKTNYIYFDNSGNNLPNTNKYFVIGHDKPTKYSKVYNSVYSTNIPHTKLAYWKNTADSWTDATYYGFVSPTSDWSNGDWGSDNLSNGGKYTAAYTKKQDLANGKYYLFDTNGSASNGATLYVSEKSSYSDLNKNQYAVRIVLAKGASSFARSSSNSIGSVSIDGYYLSVAGGCSSNSADVGANESNSVQAAYTGELTYTASPGSGYVFAGWYDLEPTTLGSQTPVSTDLTYTCDAPINANWMFAGFIEDTPHDVTISYRCISPSKSIQDNAVRAVGELITSSISAPEIPGYTFSSWEVGNGIDYSTSSLTANPIVVKAKASGTYTMTAKYTEDLSSTYVLKGAFDSWGSGIAMSKKTGHSDEDWVYATRSFTGSTTKTAIKIYDGNSNWYGKASTNITKTLGSLTKSVTGLSYGGGDEKNMYLEHLVTGTYEIGYNTSTHELVVTWPDVNQIQITSGDASSPTTAGYYDFDGVSGTVYSKAFTFSKNKRYSAKIIFHSDFYAFNTTSDMTISNHTSWRLYDTANGANICNVYSPVAGSYTYQFNSNDGGETKLTVVYPTAYTITFGAGTINGSNSAISVTASPTFSSGDYVLKTTAVTFKKGTTKAGYTWKGWYSNAGGSGTLHSSTDGNWTSVANTRTGNISVYACYNLVNYTITYNLNGGSNPGGAPTSFTVESATITLPTPSKTGYTFNGWYTNSSFTGDAVTQIAKGSYGNKEYWAKWTPITYSIHFNGNGNTSGSMSNQTGITYDSETTLTANAFVKIGYNFAGWATTADGPVVRVDGAAHGNLSSTQGATVQLYAKWTPKTCTVSFSQSGEGYGSGGQSTTKTATYDAAMPTPITCPTAANGYAFMGYFGAANGEGTQYYNADGTSAHNWDQEGATATLYAYFKKAEITVAIDQSVFEPVAAGGSSWVQATPTVEPEPVGPVKICWALLYDDENPVPAGHDPVVVSGNVVKFNLAGLAAGSYRIRATLRTGSSCDGGTLLSTFDKSVTIANEFTVSVKYMCGTEEIKASTTTPGKATEWTSIDAPDIFGYTFSTWDLGDGGITKHESDALTKKTGFRFKASYNGTLTAKYNKNKYIYLDLSQTFGSGKWSNPYCYLYNSDGYWDNTHGAGATGGNCVKKGAMTQITGTDIWYFDYSDASAFIAAGNNGKLAFTWGNHMTQANFGNVDAIYRTDFSEGTPLFIPAVGQNKEDMSTTCCGTGHYYSKGYWTNYTGSKTGYTLLIYNSSDVEIKRIPFTSVSNDMRMTMKATVDLEATTTYKVEILRDNGHYYKNNAERNYGNSQTNWEYREDLAKGNLVTTAAGDYVFTLSYTDYNNNKTFHIRMKVDYPAAVNDFQVMYNDNATWSLGTAHGSGWRHPSRMIKARANGVDTISFFVAKTNSPKLYARKVTNASSMTWASLNIAGAESMNLSVDSSAVYNFKVTQGSAGVISSIENIGAYTGEYYIRCDAMNSKWDNYTSDNDHRMTYSSFSESDANAFGEKFSHYKAKWCKYGKNVKFVIANDYSPCISDTLTQDVPNTYNNIDDYGFLKNDGTVEETQNIYSANIRFMWNRKTNKISRAYVASSTNPERLFLVLRGNYAIKSIDNEDMEDEGTGIPSVILRDDQNWMYEEILYIKPNTRFKLYACYAQGTASPNGAQYFRGSYNGNAFSGDPGVDSDNSVVLIGGDGGYQKARVLYDFKTNRLICAWLPSNEAVSGDLKINSDVMIIREHQEAAQYITFANGDSKLSGVKTVYGVMKFNRWVLNNRKSSGNDHGPLEVGDQKSEFERSLYFISFPFDVRVSDIFGFGHYWDEWYLEYYDGLTRAKNGFWIDSPPNWKYVTPEMATNYVLKANEGYILGLDLEYMPYNNEEFWAHDIETIELFFPSTAELATLKQTTCTIPALSSDYKCTINRTGEDGDRRVKDSYWRCIGTPSLNLYNTAVTDGSGNAISWKTDYTWHADEREFPFIYMWNKTDNTLTPQLTSTFNFLPMHSYLVQNGGQIVWTNVSAKPSSIVARNADDTPAMSYNWRLALISDTTLIDQTYVRMNNLEQVTDTFDFGQDMSKEFNAYRSDIYTKIGYERVAANSMPLNTETTTIVPVGIKVYKAGEFKLAMPDGTDGIGITLVDSETGIRTQLGALDYTVTLDKGTYDERFYLEISPIHNTPTGMENGGSIKGENGVRKVIIDQNMYIIRDGKMYNVQGARCN